MVIFDQKNLTITFTLAGENVTARIVNYIPEHYMHCRVLEDLVYGYSFFLNPKADSTNRILAKANERICNMDDEDKKFETIMKNLTESAKGLEMEDYFEEAVMKAAVKATNEIIDIKKKELERIQNMFDKCEI